MMGGETCMEFQVTSLRLLIVIFVFLVLAYLGNILVHKPLKSRS